ILLVGALGEIDVAHAAAAQLAQDPVRTEPLTLERSWIVRAALAGRDLVPETRLRNVLADAEQHMRQQCLVGAAGMAHVFRALTRTERESALDDRRSVVGGRVHGRQSCISHALTCNNENGANSRSHSWRRRRERLARRRPPRRKNRRRSAVRL